MISGRRDQQKGGVMEVLQVELPPELVQRLRQAMATDEILSQVIAEAVQMWLQRRHAEQRQTEQGLQVLRHAGLVMDGARQRALAAAMRPTRCAEDAPTRAQVEAALSRLHVPLSEEILAMRGAR
jgi:predicted transcriptional regulator